MGLQEISPSPAAQLVFPLCRRKLKIQVSLCQRKWKVWVSHMKKWENGPNSAKTFHTAKFSITNPPRCGSLVLLVSTETENLGQPLWKNRKMVLTLQKLVIQQNFQLLTPPKSGSPVVLVSTEMENLHQPLWKNVKMALTLQKLVIQQNFQLPTPHPPQCLGFRFSLYQQQQKIWVSHYEKMEKMALNVQKRVTQQKFPVLITNPPPKSFKNYQTPTQISTPPLSKSQNLCSDAETPCWYSKVFKWRHQICHCWQW